MTLYECAVDPLGAFDTLSCGDDQLARLSLVKGSGKSLLSVNYNVARLGNVLFDLLADLLTGLKSRILHGEDDLICVLLGKSSHILTAFLITFPAAAKYNSYGLGFHGLFDHLVQSVHADVVVCVVNHKCTVFPMVDLKSSWNIHISYAASDLCIWNAYEQC